MSTVATPSASRPPTMIERRVKLGDGREVTLRTMTPDSLQELLKRLTAGQLSIDDAMEELASLPFHDLGHSTLDTHRELRQGVPEPPTGTEGFRITD